MAPVLHLEVYIEILPAFGRSGKPAVCLRKFFTDQEEIKLLMSKAFKDEIIPAKIYFRNKLNAVIRLVDCGILDKDFIDRHNIPR
jgi:hypothetical protein